MYTLYVCIYIYSHDIFMIFPWYFYLLDRQGTFDLVYSFDVFVHMDLHEMRHTLHGVREVLKPGPEGSNGWLIEGSSPLNNQWVDDDFMDLIMFYHVDFNHFGYPLVLSKAFYHVWSIFPGHQGIIGDPGMIFTRFPDSFWDFRTTYVRVGRSNDSSVGE